MATPKMILYAHKGQTLHNFVEKLVRINELYSVVGKFNGVPIDIDFGDTVDTVINKYVKSIQQG
jgi:hypothetical protein